MKLTTNQLNVINDVVLDAQAWADNAVDRLGVEKGEMAILAKVARWQEAYNTRLSEGNYKNRAVRDAEIEANDPNNQNNWTPMQKWEFAMKKQERMSGLNRDTENLITDNPTFVVNEYTQVKYDAKVALRATKP